MADFYLDEDVSHSLKPLLESVGHGVTTTRQQRREGASDGNQFLYAATSAWIMITHNKKDFELLHDAWIHWTTAWNLNHRYHGVLIISQLVLPQDNAAAIDALLSAHPNVENQLLGYDITTRGYRPLP